MILALLIAAGAAGGDLDSLEKPLCPSINALVRAAPDDFASVTKLKLPRGTKCGVHTGKGPAWYACELHATSCKGTEKSYAETKSQLTQCLKSDPREETAGNKRNARWAVPAKKTMVRLSFVQDSPCLLRLFVENQ